MLSVEEKSPHGFDCVADVNVGDGVVAAFVVDLVTDDRIIDITHVDADLVRAAGFDLDIEQCKFAVSLPHFP